jgi:uncharacterized membrane protein
MITVKLYTRKDCHLCDQVLSELNALSSEIPHQVEVVDVDYDPGMLKAYGSLVPVVVIGPYQLKAPILPQDLKITLKAAQRGQDQNQAIDLAIAQGQYPSVLTWTRADRFSYWLSKHYLALVNLIVFIYLGLPILAPILMKARIDGPASLIYRAYGALCHQMAFRSWFLFGEQIAYPRGSAGVDDLISYEEATGLSTQDLWAARQFIGNETLGYKIALCERDIAIYGAILAFGLLYVITGRKIPPLRWYVWILLALVPIGLDGLSQFASQPPFNLIPYRESTPFLRTLTGALFGFTTAWFGYPMVEESMVDTRRYMVGKMEKFNRIKREA